MVIEQKHMLPHVQIICLIDPTQTSNIRKRAAFMLALSSTKCVGIFAFNL